MTILDRRIWGVLKTIAQVLGCIAALIVVSLVGRLIGGALLGVVGLVFIALRQVIGWLISPWAVIALGHLVELVLVLAGSLSPAAVGYVVGGFVFAIVLMPCSWVRRLVAWPRVAVAFLEVTMALVVIVGAVCVLAVLDILSHHDFPRAGWSRSGRCAR